MSLPIEVSLFDTIAPQIKYMRPSDRYIEIDVTGVSVDQDKLVSYFDDVGWVIRHGKTELHGRIKTQDIFNQLRKAWNKLGFDNWDFKYYHK